MSVYSEVGRYSQGREKPFKKKIIYMIQHCKTDRKKDKSITETKMESMSSFIVDKPA